MQPPHRHDRLASHARLCLRAAERALVLTVLCATSACDEGESPDVLDAGTSVFDAALDADHASSSGEPGPHGDGGARAECHIEGDAFARPIEASDGRGWAAAQHDDLVHLALTEPTCGGVGAASGTRIAYVHFASTGPFSDPVALTPAHAGRCLLRHAPAFAPSTDALDLYYTANDEGSFELYRRAIAGSQVTQRVTYDLPEARLREQATVAAPFVEGALLAYVQQGARGTPARLVTQRPGLPEREIAYAPLGLEPARLALSVWPSANVAGVLGWVSESPGARAMLLQPLDETGGARGEVATLTRAVGTLSDLAIAATSTSAAVVYTVQAGAVAALRFRQLDDEGRPLREVALTATDRSVQSPAIAPYAKGFAIAFREVPMRSDVPASLRLMFVAENGQVGGERRIADAARSGGGARVFVMNDGRLVVVWSDQERSGVTLRAVRARCY